MPLSELNYSSKTRMLAGILFSVLLLYLFLLFGAHALLQLFDLKKINASIFFITRIYYWFSLLLVWLFSNKVEKQPLLLWKENEYSFLKYIKIIVLIFLTLILCLVIVQRLLQVLGINGKSRMLQNLLIIFRDHKSLIFVTAITAGVVEEFIFRGYLLPRLETLLGSSFAALFISSIVFGLLHFGYGTISNIAGPSAIGFVLGYYYQRYRSLKTIIIVHVLWDLLAIFASMGVKVGG